MIKKEWFEDNKPYKGYKWSIQAQYGIIEITTEELFSRVEFKPLTHEQKIKYADYLGWRYNVDNGRWYRIMGY